MGVRAKYCCDCGKEFPPTNHPIDFEDEIFRREGYELFGGKCSDDWHAMLGGVALILGHEPAYCPDCGLKIS